jgi:hypothetical protein
MVDGPNLVRSPALKRRGGQPMQTTSPPTILPTAPGETACADAIFQQPWWLDAVAPGTGRR